MFGGSHDFTGTRNARPTTKRLPLANSLKLKKVRNVGATDGQSFAVHLFRGSGGSVCAWYLGPVSLVSDKLTIPYLSPSTETRAPIAIVRAIEAAESAQSKLFIVDPDDLWGSAWQAGFSTRHSPT